jgi:hypothetical protein
MTGVLAVTAGTAALPAITPSGDPNTGIFSPGADQLAISTNGSRRLYVASDGKVGIETSSPTHKLDVRESGTVAAVVDVARISTGAGSTAESRLLFGTFANTVNAAIGAQTLSETAGVLKFYVDASDVLTERMRITSTGRLGLGTSSPTARLDVGNIAGNVTAGDFTVDTTNGSAVVTVGRLSSTGGDSTNFRVRNRANGEVFFVDGVNGRVGIGSNSPSQPLHIATGSGSAFILQTNGTATTFLGPDSSNTGLFGTTTNHATRFITNDTERARIDTSGRLLIGTSLSRDKFFNSSSLNPGIQLEGSAFSNRTISIVSNNNSAANDGPLLVLGRQRSNSNGGYTLVDNNDSLGVVTFQGADNTELVEGARIETRVDGTPGANNMPGRLVMSVAAAGAAGSTEAFRITNDRVRAYNQAAPAAVNATATLTVANLKTGIITSTSAAATDMTLPTGTDTEGGFSGIYTNMTFEWSVINTGPSLVTVLANTAHTLVGSGAVATGTSARFASRRSGANTFVTYRLS